MFTKREEKYEKNKIFINNNVNIKFSNFYNIDI